MFSNNPVFARGRCHIAPRHYHARMVCGDIRPEQAAKLIAQVGRQLRYLNRLCARMDRLGFTPDDPLWRAAQEARNAVNGLHVMAHYTGCRSRAGW